jgi:hypothetical protein
MNYALNIRASNKKLGCNYAVYRLSDKEFSKVAYSSLQVGSQLHTVELSIEVALNSHEPSEEWRAALRTPL